jgi:hypothetical protein
MDNSHGPGTCATTSFVLPVPSPCRVTGVHHTPEEGRAVGDAVEETEIVC